MPKNGSIDIGGQLNVFFGFNVSHPNPEPLQYVQVTYLLDDDDATSRQRRAYTAVSVTHDITRQEMKDAAKQICGMTGGSIIVDADKYDACSMK